MRNEFHKRRRELARLLILGACATMCVAVLAAIGVGQGQNTTQTVAEKRYKPELVIQTGHASDVTSVAFSPDGKTLASGSRDKTIKLWNVESGQQIKSLEGHNSLVSSVAFSPDGKTLASGNWDKTIKLWNVESGQQIKSLEGHADSVNSVAFSPDGKTLASGSNDETIKLWNVESGQQIKSLEGHASDVTSVAFSPDGKTLASGNWDKTIKLWNVESGQQIKSLEGHNSWVNSVAFSPDGKTLASGSADNTIKLWSVESGQQIKSLEGHANTVNSVAFSPDGKTLASGSFDKTIKLWSVEMGQQIKSLEGHASTVSEVAFSPDGKTLASGNADKTIKLWSVESGQQIKSLEDHPSSVHSVAFSPDGKTLASPSDDNTIKLWNVESGQQIKSLEGHPYWIVSVAFSPDGKTLASGSGDKTIKLWNVESSQQIKSLEDHPSSVVSVAFSPDGKTLASGSNDNTIKLWSVESCQQIKSLEGHADSVVSVAFSPDGKTLASGSDDNTIKLWNVESGQQIKSLEGHANTVNSVAFSPDGKTLASGSFDKTIKLWSVETGQQIKSLEGHANTVNSVAFSPDGKTLASGNADKTIKLWNVESGQQIKSLEGHADSVNSVAFSPDGNFFVSGSRDATMKLWDTQSNKLLATLISLNKDKSVVTTPDGRFDTNQSLDKVDGLVWVLPDQPLIPKPLEIFMRQYYEPNLLPRLMKCTMENNCEQEFKPLPSIADINRIQPKVAIKEIKPAASATDSVDVTIEVESATDEVSISATDRTKKKQLVSGAYDLRLFRDGQLVGVSSPSDKLETFIKTAPQKIEETKEYVKRTGKLTDTPEDEAWREANDLAQFAGAKIDEKIKTNCVYKAGKATCVFRDIKLPKDGRKEIEFSAYLFNADRVKSETKREIYKIEKPETREGVTYLVSIGVNASENANYNLRYAANDARETQRILGERMRKANQKVVSIALVSDYDKDGKLIENHARKEIIKGVFSLLAGKGDEVSTDVLKQIPIQIDGKRIQPTELEAVQPEDRLIITFSGHGYADRNGIFYLLPYDIGKESNLKNSLPKLISSDELSLWMRDVTAREMLMIVDACHSAAAVQGDNFKPGPMGSRGLGQLAYDKGMKILSATRADSVALEINCLKQGLLSYALLQDGIEKGKADSSTDKKLFAREWLLYAERRVPQLYEEMQTDKLKFCVGGKPKSFVDCLEKECAADTSQQQPALFDFTAKKADYLLLNLP